jgi:hypothetical protein
MAESAKRIPSVAEGREDVCLIALERCRSGATNFEWTGGKVSSFLSNRLLGINRLLGLNRLLGINSVVIKKRRCGVKELSTKSWI